ncbi:MAG: Mrp/NBP35 family ATP-binding protein [Gemmatimonadetes bacterium]|nr:Mrp/NBP35 family ATP-binding protein [Gemmatimonadota bacterium]
MVAPRVRHQLDMVRALAITGDRVSFILEVDPARGKAMEPVRQAAEAAVGAVEGVASVSAVLTAHSATPSEPKEKGPPPELNFGKKKPAEPAEKRIPGIDSVIAIASGKGGVGKSTVAANLAIALTAQGKRVGLLDADVYGPNIPTMFGEGGRPRVTGAKGSERIEPLQRHGVRLMSLGFLLDKEQPAIMRGPLIAGILKQFLEQVEWGALDVLVVDMPPGTGDAQLSLVQTIDLDGAVMVTTPQDVSTGDVRRAIRMFERVNTRVLGVVENMAGYRCPHCGEDVAIFGHGGGERLAQEMDVPFLGRVPLDPEVSAAGDRGEPTALSAPDSPAGEALAAVAESLRETLEAAPARP